MLMRHNQRRRCQGQTTLSFLLFRQALGCIRVELCLQLVVRIDQALDEAVVDLLKL